MTLSLAALTSVLLVPLLLGAALVSLLGLRASMDRLAHPAWCALVGGLGTGAVLFAWSWLGWPYDARLLVPCLLVLAAGAAWLARRVRLAGRARAPSLAALPSNSAPSHAPRWEEALFLAVVGLLVCSTLARILHASTGAIAIGDEALIWTRKAQVLFDAGGLNANFGAEARVLVMHADYPLLNPLLQLWTFAHERALLWVEPRFPVQLFALALLLALAAALRRVLRPGVAAVVLVLAHSVDAGLEQTSLAGADQMVAFGLLVAADAWLRWMRAGSVAWARLAFVALAFLVAAKNDGALLAVCFGLAAAVAALRAPRHRPRLRVLAWAALPLAVLVATWLTNLRFGFANDLATAGAPGILRENIGERLRPLLAFFGRLFFERPRENAGLFAVLLVLALLAPRRVLRGRAGFLTVLALCAVVGWLVVYLATPYRLRWHLVSSAARVTYQIVPTLGLWLALVLAQDPWLGRWLRPRRVALRTSGSCAARPLTS